MAACAAYLEKARWGDGFACPHCGTAGEPFHFENRPGVLRCRKCRQNTGLTVGTVMERSHTPLNVWFWAAYLVASQTPGMSAVQFQRQLGLSRYETAFQILRKLRSTHDPESAASPTSSPSGPPDHPFAVPSPSANPPANQGTTESDGADLINGLLGGVIRHALSRIFGLDGRAVGRGARRDLG